MVCGSHRPQRHCSCPKLTDLNFKVPPTPLLCHSWLAEAPSSGCRSQLSVLTGEATGNGRRASLFCYFACKGRLNFTLSCILLAYATRYPIMCGQLICVLDYTSLFWLGSVTLIAFEIYREGVLVSVCDRNTVMKIAYESSDADWFIY